MKTTDKIIELLKHNGAMTAKQLAAELKLTSMGARQHLQWLEQQQLVSFYDQRAARGRPTRYWQLTTNAQSKFPDGHDELTVQMIESIKVVFGEQGLQKLIQQRELDVAKKYHNVLCQQHDLKAKLEALTQLRTAEGYMATLEFNNGEYWLMENHCPICAAATECQSFCRSELHLFSELLTPLAEVKREEHILEGARRCAYRIKPTPTD